jgi:plasmid stability protein
MTKNLPISACKKVDKCYHFAIMPTLVIKSFPPDLHSRLKKIAATHRRSVTQETIQLIEKALEHEEKAISSPPVISRWANRTILPEYATMEQSGAFRNGTDSSVSISEERDKQ